LIAAYWLIDLQYYDGYSRQAGKMFEEIATSFKH